MSPPTSPARSAPATGAAPSPTPTPDLFGQQPASGQARRQPQPHQTLQLQMTSTSPTGHTRQRKRPRPLVLLPALRPSKWRAIVPACRRRRKLSTGSTTSSSTYSHSSAGFRWPTGRRAVAPPCARAALFRRTMGAGQQRKSAKLGPAAPDASHEPMVIAPVVIEALLGRRCQWRDSRHMMSFEDDDEEFASNTSDDNCTDAYGHLHHHMDQDERRSDNDEDYATDANIPADSDDNADSADTDSGLAVQSRVLARLLGARRRAPHPAPTR